MVPGQAARPRTYIVLNSSARVSGTALRISVALPPEGQSSGRALGSDGVSVDSVRIPQFRDSFSGGSVCVCVHGGHGRPYGVACCGRQTVQQQRRRRTHTHRSPPLSPTLPKCLPYPAVYRRTPAPRMGFTLIRGFVEFPGSLWKASDPIR